ncbi:hypothetical protein [Paracoccus sp. NSM]|uniref:hypothetical protein n=1 Tax=Paracoccus sp. NSM TaxID=3457784 RepID=UPI0040373436
MVALGIGGQVLDLGRRVGVMQIVAYREAEQLPHGLDHGVRRRRRLHHLVATYSQMARQELGVGLLAVTMVLAEPLEDRPTRPTGRCVELPVHG